MVSLNIPHHSLENGKGTLLSNYTAKTDVTGYTIKGADVHLTQFGTITLLEGFEWDFATGAIDDPAMVAASAVHDGFYKLLRAKLLPMKNRKKADKAFKSILRKGGVGWFRRQYAYAAVRLGGGFTL